MVSGNVNKEDEYRGRGKRGRRWDENLVLSWRKYKVSSFFDVRILCQSGDYSNGVGGDGESFVVREATARGTEVGVGRCPKEVGDA